eukprot:m.150297 g.150297  ORF g.150297 m.150297 type:complete len:401 (+) comp11681_c0_seq3:854-2056(+)
MGCTRSDIPTTGRTKDRYRVSPSICSPSGVDGRNRRAITVQHGIHRVVVIIEAFSPASHCKVDGSVLPARKSPRYIPAHIVDLRWIAAIKDASGTASSMHGYLSADNIVLAGNVRVSLNVCTSHTRSSWQRAMARGCNVHRIGRGLQKPALALSGDDADPSDDCSVFTFTECNGVEAVGNWHHLRCEDPARVSPLIRSKSSMYRRNLVGAVIEKGIHTVVVSIASRSLSVENHLNVGHIRCTVPALEQKRNVATQAVAGNVVGPSEGPVWRAKAVVVTVACACRSIVGGHDRPATVLPCQSRGNTTSHLGVRAWEVGTWVGLANHGARKKRHSNRKGSKHCGAVCCCLRCVVCCDLGFFAAISQRLSCERYRFAKHHMSRREESESDDVPTQSFKISCKF